MRILIVEDERRTAENLHAFILDSFPGVAVEGVFSSGEAALAFMKAHWVDMVLTDICMSGMSGLELIGCIRTQYPAVQVVVLSAYDHFEYVREAFLMGVKDYLLKPIDRIELGTVLAERACHGRSNPGGADETGMQARVIEKVKRIIDERIDKNISLATLAEAVNMNPQYLSSLFKDETGENLFSYVTRMRIEKAQELLCHTSLKINEIAAIAGYSDYKYFSYVFKRVTGLTPSEYRLQAWVMPSSNANS